MCPNCETTYDYEYDPETLWAVCLGCGHGWYLDEDYNSRRINDNRS